MRQQQSPPCRRGLYHSYDVISADGGLVGGSCEFAIGAPITDGIFHYSRNPIFLGMHLVFLDLFLLLSTPLTLLLWVLGEVMIQIQVRLEEDYLTETFGNEYMNYQRHIRRWI